MATGWLHCFYKIGERIRNQTSDSQNSNCTGDKEKRLCPLEQDEGDGWIQDRTKPEISRICSPDQGNWKWKKIKTNQLKSRPETLTLCLKGKTSHYRTSGKHKLKLHWGIALFLLGWLLSKSQEGAHVGKSVKQGMAGHGL